MQTAPRSLNINFNFFFVKPQGCLLYLALIPGKYKNYVLLLGICIIKKRMQIIQPDIIYKLHCLFTIFRTFIFIQEQSYINHLYTGTGFEQLPPRHIANSALSTNSHLHQAYIFVRVYRRYNTPIIKYTMYMVLV